MRYSALVFSMLILISSRQQVIAGLIADQVFEPDNRNLGIIKTIGKQPDVLLAQTFTVARAGHLAAVELLIAKEPSISSSLLLEVRATSSGIPSDFQDDILAVSSLESALLPPAQGSFNVVPYVTPKDARWVCFQFTPIPVNEGDVLALVPRSSAPGSPAGFFYWIAGGELEYPTGSAYRLDAGGWVPELGQFAQKVTDAGFRTYVTVVPEPSQTLLLPVLGLLLRAWYKKNVNRRSCMNK